MRNTFIDMLVEYAEKNKDVVLLTGDLGTGCLEKFIERFPDRFFNVGIAEQSMIGIASGLAKEGKKVFCYSICNFAVERPYEFLRNLACYHNLDVKVGISVLLEVFSADFAELLAELSILKGNERSGYKVKIRCGFKDFVHRFLLSK